MISGYTRLNVSRLGICTGAFGLLLALAGMALGQSSTSVVNSPHNLSAGGPGTVKAVSEAEVCIFCHTPHNATPVQPLWNRQLPTSSYKTYTSNSLKALPGQPTGSSKLCLSCHDGTIALGSVNSRMQPIQMANGITTLPPGKSNLGTDLSDDHPISFVYDASLVVKNPKLRDPRSLPSNVRLDADGNLQCTTCHDAHNNQYGKFLVMSNTASELCNTCHTMAVSGTVTDIAQHTGCDNCHQSHSAPSGPYLLTKAQVGDTCLTCHSGGVGLNQGPNIATALAQAYPHDTHSAVNLPNHIPDNVDCKDCHEPHTSKKTNGVVTAAPGVSPALGKVDGVSIAGSPVSSVQYGYEVCLKCHGDNSHVEPLVQRQIVSNNTRLEFSSTAISFHPVAAKGKEVNVPSLRPGYTTNSMIACTDCHGSDTSVAAGGTGPNGPHGSTYPGMLLKRYETADNTPYSTTAYALCFTCHDNTKVVANSGPFPYHQTHVQDQRTPCSVCHDSHGIPSAQGSTTGNAALINFDTTVVFQSPTTHSIQYMRTGSGNGTCTLLCHGHNHVNTTY